MTGAGRAVAKNAHGRPRRDPGVEDRRQGNVSVTDQTPRRQHKHVDLIWHVVGLTMPDFVEGRLVDAGYGTSALFKGGDAVHGVLGLGL